MNYIYRCGFLSVENMMLGIPIRDILEQEYERDMENFIMELNDEKLYSYKYGVRETLAEAMKDIRALAVKEVINLRDEVRINKLPLPDYYFPVFTNFGANNPHPYIGHGYMWKNIEKAYPIIWADVPVMGKKYEIGTVEEKVFETAEEK